MSIAYAAAQYLKTVNNPVKHEQWQHVLVNMAAHAVDVGSRVPVAGFPAWATPEVAPGGFATGRMVAGGDLVAHEREMIQELGACGLIHTTSDRMIEQRQALQAYLTSTNDGLSALAYRLHSQLYRIEAPEEGCLMVYAWLCERGQSEAAAQLLAAVAPFFDRLRFHPAPLTRPDDFTRVSISRVDALLASVDAQCTAYATTVRSCEVGKARVLFWDQILKLWAATLDDPTAPPTGYYIPTEQLPKGSFRVSQYGSWPCQSYPPSWYADAAAVERFYAEHEATLSTTPHYYEAIGHVRRAMDDHTSLTGREVGRIRWWLASANATHGLPGAAWYVERLRTTLQSLDAASRTPLYHDYYKELAATIRAHVDDSTNALSHDAADAIATAMEAKFPGFKLLKALRRRLSAATAMTHDELYASDLVSSPDMMAIPLFTFASNAMGDQVLDESARYLYKQLYRCFLKRRSLLLLNFASQVKISELPWVIALDRELTACDLKSQELTGMNEFVRITVGRSMRRYGEIPVRNPFVRVLQVLFKATATQCVLLEELAADIFEGGFVPKFARAHAQAKVLLAGSCYDRYYDIQEDPDDGQEGGFFSLCAARAERNHSQNPHKSYVACNGMVIEQAQILTTHNMATLFETFDLARSLEDWDVLAIIRRGLGLILTKLCRVYSIKTQETNSVTGSIGPLLRDVGGLWRQLVFWFAILEKYDARERYLEIVNELETAALPVDGLSGCRLEKYQEFFRDLIRVLRDPSARPPSRVVLGWSA